MTFDWFKEHFPNVPVTEEQVACIRYLERTGKRFWIDFGYENAPQIVWAEMDDEYWKCFGDSVED